MKRATTILLSAIAITSTACGGGSGSGSGSASGGASGGGAKSAGGVGSAAEVVARARAGAVSSYGESAISDFCDDGACASAASEPAYAGLARYERRCQRLADVGAKARVLYQKRREMTRGDPDTITAAVTLNQTAPPDRVLRRADVVGEGLVVSCRIQAKLSASSYEFEVNEGRWMERSFLTADTARWSWYVRPKVGGMQTLVLTVRPILRMKEQGDPTVSAEASNVQQYETSVHVKVPLSQRPQELMSSLAQTFKVAEGLVKALTLLIVAVLSLGAVLGVRRRKKRPSPRDKTHVTA